MFVRGVVRENDGVEECTRSGVGAEGRVEGPKAERLSGLPGSGDAMADSNVEKSLGPLVAGCAVEDSNVETSSDSSLSMTGL